MLNPVSPALNPRLFLLSASCFLLSLPPRTRPWRDALGGAEEEGVAGADAGADLEAVGRLIAYAELHGHSLCLATGDPRDHRRHTALVDRVHRHLERPPRFGGHAPLSEQTRHQLVARVRDRNEDQHLARGGIDRGELPRLSERGLQLTLIRLRDQLVAADRADLSVRVYEAEPAIRGRS